LPYPVGGEKRKIRLKIEIVIELTVWGGKNPRSPLVGRVPGQTIMFAVLDKPISKTAGKANFFA